MMMVVADTALVTGGRPGGLNAADDALLGQHSQCVVHRLSRNGADLSANVLGHVVGRAMRPLRHRPQHRQALSCDLDTVLAKCAGKIVRSCP